MYKEINFNNVESFFNMIKTEALAENWTVEFESLSSPDSLKLYLKNPTDDMVVFYNFDRKTSSSSIDDEDQEISVNVASEYNTENDYNRQTNQAIDQGMDYAFPFYDNILSKCFLSINSNRILLINRQSDKYLPLYMGKYLAYASPVQNQHPYIVLGGKGNWSSNPFYSTNEQGGMSYFSAKYKNTIVGSKISSSYFDAVGVIYPYSKEPNDFSNLNDCYKIYNSPNSFLIFDIEIFSDATNENFAKGALGSLDGVFATGRSNNSSEFEFTFNEEDFIMFESFGVENLKFVVKKQ